MPDIWTSLFKVVDRGLTNKDFDEIGKMVYSKLREKWNNEGYGTEANKTYVEITVGTS